MTIRYRSSNPFAPTLTEDSPKEEPWLLKAKCASYIDDTIMQGAWVDEESPLKRNAVDICFTCPVREECLRDAAVDDEAVGIRAGFEFEDGKVNYRDQQAIKKEFGITVKARRNVVGKRNVERVARELRESL
jgi:hypothetical protein